MAYERQIRPMLTVREVAEMLHIHTNTVRRWSDQGVLRAYRITHRGDRRFRREDVALFLADLNDTSVKSTSEPGIRTLV
jgi:excisionase family DNA binding protein